MSMPGMFFYTLYLSWGIKNISRDNKIIIDATKAKMQDSIQTNAKLIGSHLKSGIMAVAHLIIYSAVSNHPNSIFSNYSSFISLTRIILLKESYQKEIWESYASILSWNKLSATRSFTMIVSFPKMSPKCVFI